MMASDRPVSTSPEAASAPSTASVSDRPPAVLRRSPFLAGFDRLLALGLVILAFGIASFAVADSDFWRHLAAGRLVARGEYPFGKDPFSFVDGDRRWINHAWLGETAAYLAFANIGPSSVVVIKAVLVAGLALLLLGARVPGESLWPGVMAIGLALLASAPWLTLQPLLLSIFFTGLVLFLLVRVKTSRLPTAMVIVSCLWANTDQWFFIGPLMIALYTIGLALRRGEGESERSIAPYAIALGCAVLGGCLNPYHVAAWRLPVELTSDSLAKTLGRDPRFAPLFAGLFDADGLDFTGAQGGNPVNASAFALLTLALAVSFALNARRCSLGLLFINIGLLALTVVHVRALPLFAIVAGPTTALNLTRFLASLRERAFSPTTLQLLAAGRVAARMGLLAAGALALLACYPGWLHPFKEQRRLSWEAAPDPGLADPARRLQEWRTSGKLPSEAHGVVLSVDLANYCAWFAPAERTFFDSRLAFHAPEAEVFERMRLALATYPLAGTPAPAFDFDEFFRERKLSYLAMVAPGDANEFSDSLLPLLATAAPKTDPPALTWSLWDILGRSAIVGWRKQETLTPDAYAALRFAPRPRAFGAEVRPFTETPPPEPIPKRDLWGKYLTPAPRVATATIEAGLLRSAARFQVARLQARQQAMINAEVAVLGSLGGSAPVVVIDSNQERQAADIHSASLLAVRAARRGVARSPFDPESCLMLAKCYEERGFFAPSPDLRQDVFMANLAKFIASQPADAGYSIVLQDAAFQLSQAQYRAGRFDAAVAAYRLFASMFRRQPVSPERRPDFQEQLKNIENELTKAESALRRREDLWLNSRNDPFRALPPDQRGFTYIGARVEVQDAALARAVLAMRNGLSQKALESLRGIDLGSTSKLDFGERFVAIMSLAQTLLATGQIAEALAAMNDFESQHGNDLVAPPHLGPRLSFTLMKSQVLFAGGQFRELEELLKRQIHDLRTVLDISSRDPRVVQYVAMYAARRLAGGALFALAEPGYIIHPRGYDGSLRQYRDSTTQLASILEELRYRLALAALEQGDNTAAATGFQELIKQASFANDRVRNAQTYLVLMDRRP